MRIDWKRALGLVALFTALAPAICIAPRALADTGVLIPGDKQAPDPSILSLTSIEVDIRIDNGDARVWIRQIFTNHTGQPQEGNYLFALPSGTQVSDFAVWDGPVRIPAVILERKRAEAIYEDLKSQAIDPGLLEQGERTEEDARHNSIFSAHIVPIPAWGTKRLEIEYHQRILVNDRKSYFLLPLKPDAYALQHVDRLSIHFELHSAAPIKDFAVQNKLLSLKVDQQDEHTVLGSIEAANMDMAEDFAATWGINEAGNALDVIAYRDPNAQSTGTDFDLPASPKAEPKQTRRNPQPGYFEASALFTAPSAAQAQAAAPHPNPRTVVVLMDTSLSMQWEKLERSYAAAAKVLEGLRPGDPVLRIHTDPAIVSVIALFPFGLEKPLRYLAGEDVWETRFLAPTDMTDASYFVRLVMRDRNGQVYRESKSFIIITKPPTVKVHLQRARYRPGEIIPLTVNASSSTRTLTARVEGLAPVSLRWNHDAEASTGQLWLPAGIPPGDYVLAVTAEDMAHNLGSAEVHIEVVP